jgi:hypothetical protein
MLSLLLIKTNNQTYDFFFIFIGRLKVSDLRAKIIDRENGQLSSDNNVTPRLLASSILKDRNYV